MTHRTIKDIEMEIERINENQKYQVIEEGGAGVQHTAQYFTNLNKLEHLYDELDAMAELPIIHKGFEIKAVYSEVWEEVSFHIITPQGNLLFQAIDEAMARQLIDDFIS